MYQIHRATAGGVSVNAAQYGQRRGGWSRQAAVELLSLHPGPTSGKRLNRQKLEIAVPRIRAFRLRDGKLIGRDLPADLKCGANIPCRWVPASVH